MITAYVLRLGNGETAYYLSNLPFNERHFYLTEDRHDAIALPRHEAEEIAARYRQVKVDFAVEELRA